MLWDNSHIGGKEMEDKTTRAIEEFVSWLCEDIRSPATHRKMTPDVDAATLWAEKLQEIKENL